MEPNFLEKWRLGSAICVPNFIENGAQELELCAILRLVRRRSVRTRFLFSRFLGR